MNAQPVLGEQEWGVVLELLESEARELPTEIRHTDTSRIRQELEGRERMVNDLVRRLRAALAEA